MKRLIKAIARRGWRLTGPARRPLARKLDAKLAGAVAAGVRDETHARLDLLLHVMNVGRQEANAYRGETNLALDALVREIARLQFQVEDLQQVLLDLGRREAPLGLVADDHTRGVEEAA